MSRRQQLLMELLLARQRLSVDELSRHFGVTDMTVRRDLQSLEDQGLLTRTHGGCVLRNAPVQEQPFREKEQQERDAKETIARRGQPGSPIRGGRQETKNPSVPLNGE